MNKKVTFTKHKFLMVIESILDFFDVTSMKANMAGAFPKLGGILTVYRPVKSIKITVIITELNSRNFPELHRNFYY